MYPYYIFGQFDLYLICITLGAAACLLLFRLLADRVRLIGVGVSGFEAGGPSQLSLMPEKKPVQDEQRRGRLDKAVDTLRSRYGRDAVVRGRLFDVDPDDRRKVGVQAERAEADTWK